MHLESRRVPNLAFVFPGEGSQSPGMGLDVYQASSVAREFLHRVDTTLGFSLTKLCFEGTEEELTQTENTQPALVATSLAYLLALEDLTGYSIVPAFVAGHSLGEYSALAAAGALDYTDAVTLARRRGLLMRDASRSNPGGMVAVIGLDEDALQAICKQSDTWVANLNCPGQIVISGRRDDLEHAITLARESGAKRIIPLKTSGPFHTPLMKPIVAGLATYLDSYPLRTAKVPVVANTSAVPITSPQEIREELCRQLTLGVRWQQSVEYMITQGVDTFLAIGPGRVLANLIRRIDGTAKVVSVNSLESVMQVKALLEE